MSDLVFSASTADFRDGFYASLPEPAEAASPELLGALEEATGQFLREVRIQGRGSCTPAE